ncbi:hypothetical protein Q8A67_006540 [Cirrhinus molitorella]|uniref:Uncharacterized protein n=1 Tax=Cirrhinus molitorella TaxID=172907 RepID=A0AA88Q9A7_9TELE|nr:hypothetical protein Q8A67_006540 [Cirrhinus molitorella]
MLAKSFCLQRFRQIWAKMFHCFHCCGSLSSHGPSVAPKETEEAGSQETRVKKNYKICERAIEMDISVINLFNSYFNVFLTCTFETICFHKQFYSCAFKCSVYVVVQLSYLTCDRTGNFNICF